MFLAVLWKLNIYYVLISSINKRIKRGDTMNKLKSSYKLTNTLETARECLANAIEYYQIILDKMEYLEGLNDWDLTNELLNEELNLNDLELGIEEAEQAMEYLEIAIDFAEEQEQAIKAAGAKTNE